jgi:hypothetical protein
MLEPLLVPDRYEQINKTSPTEGEAILRTLGQICIDLLLLAFLFLIILCSVYNQQPEEKRRQGR